MYRESFSAKTGCQHVELARNTIGNVQICPDCGVVHVSLQSMTVRLTPDAFEALAELTRQAYVRLHTDARVFEPAPAHTGVAH